MFLDRIVQSPEAQNLIRDGLSALSRGGAFEALIEIGNQRSEMEPSPTPIEAAALKHAWHCGHRAAVEDLYRFFEKYVIPARTKPPADYGSLKALLDEGSITPEEYEQLSRSGRK